MTLIVYVLTEEYVVLASDRRVTTTVRGKPVKFEDSAMKTFLLNGQMMMGFTGIAKLDGLSMEQWAANVLRGVAPNDMPSALRDGMSDYYLRHPELQGVPHHFRLAGFAYNPTRMPSTFPLGYEVSNARWVASGDRVAYADVGEFRVVQNVFGNRRQAVGAVGAPYSLKALRALEGTVRQVSRGNPLDPQALFLPIVRFIRGVAARSGGTVGNTILVASIPRSSVPSRIAGWSTPLAEGALPFAQSEPTAVMYPEDAGDPIVHMPSIIYPGLQLIGMQLERLEDPLGADVGIGSADSSRTLD